MKKILIIEDDVAIRDNTQEMLETRGFQVLVAENGRIGLQIACSKLPDLILCDVMMPELDGYGVLRGLRQNTATETIPVIFLTAKATRSDIRYGMDLGADDYLAKPFTAEELLGAIASRLERQSQLLRQQMEERSQARKLRQEVNQSQQKLQETQQLETLKTELLQKLAQDLRNPLSNINMAIHLLQEATTAEDRDRYLGILQQECTREIQLLNEVDHLQKLLTPENTQLLKRFNLLGN